LFLGGLVFFLVVEAEKLIIRISRPAPLAPVVAGKLKPEAECAQ